MRRLYFLLLSAGLMAALTGCRVTTGQCDCVDLPATVVAPQSLHAVPAPTVTVAPPVAAPVISAAPAPLTTVVPSTTPDPVKVPASVTPESSTTLPGAANPDLKQVPDSIKDK